MIFEALDRFEGIFDTTFIWSKYTLFETISSSDYPFGQKMAPKQVKKFKNRKNNKNSSKFKVFGSPSQIFIKIGDIEIFAVVIWPRVLTSHPYDWTVQNVKHINFLSPTV